MKWNVVFFGLFEKFCKKCDWHWTSQDCLRQWLGETCSRHRFSQDQVGFHRTIWQLVVQWANPGPCITNVFATRRKNFSQWYRSFQRKLLSHWLKFLRHVAITLVIQGPGQEDSSAPSWAMKLFLFSGYQGPAVLHYSDIIKGMIGFTQLFVQAQIKQNIKVQCHWPLWGKFTGDRWLPLTKGQ